MRHLAKTLVFVVFILGCSEAAMAGGDTLRVMAYNVLYYGNGCQGPNGNYHQYLKTIIRHTNPDLVSLEKLASVKQRPDDKFGTAPYGFVDSILKFGLNAAFPGRYACCPFSNKARTNNQSLVFYDQQKLGFVATVSTYVNVTDFSTYKLYYKTPDLASTRDTVFLYVTANHTMSGDEFEKVRNIQVTGVMDGIKRHFSRLGNHINLGDFNVRTSDEGFYQLLTSPGPLDTGFRFYDPPFYPDRVLQYPANWDHNGKFLPYFTTSTRVSASIPNSCGSGGGGKNWYDHIFLSSWIVNGNNHLRYVPRSYRTIGNDGQRFKVSINNGNIHKNASAPPEVIEALYQMSNKYPIMVDIEVNTARTGNPPVDPEISGTDLELEEVSVDGPADGVLTMHFPTHLSGQQVSVRISDQNGAKAWKNDFVIHDLEVQSKCKLASGEYTLTIEGHHNLIFEKKIVIP